MRGENLIQNVQYMIVLHVQNVEYWLCQTVVLETLVPMAYVLFNFCYPRLSSDGRGHPSF